MVSLRACWALITLLGLAVCANGQDDRERVSLNATTSIEFPATHTWQLNSSTNEFHYLPAEDMGSLELIVQELSEVPCAPGQRPGTLHCHEWRLSFTWLNHVRPPKGVPMKCHLHVSKAPGGMNERPDPRTPEGSKNGDQDIVPAQQPVE